jgi:hypothetical protein
LVQLTEQFGAVDAFAGPSETAGEALSPHALTTSRGFKPATALVEAAVGKLKASLAKRGCDAIMRLGRRFRIMDDDSSNGLTYDEVCTICNCVPSAADSTPPAAQRHAPAASGQL